MKKQNEILFEGGKHLELVGQDVAGKITDYLDRDKDLNNLSLVCKFWCDVVRKNRVERSILDSIDLNKLYYSIELSSTSCSIGVLKDQYSNLELALEMLSNLASYPYDRFTLYIQNGTQNEIARYELDRKLFVFNFKYFNQHNEKALKELYDRTTDFLGLKQSFIPKENVELKNVPENIYEIATLTPKNRTLTLESLDSAYTQIQYYNFLLDKAPLLALHKFIYELIKKYGKNAEKKVIFISLYKDYDDFINKIIKCGAGSDVDENELVSTFVKSLKISTQQIVSSKNIFSSLFSKPNEVSTLAQIEIELNKFYGTEPKCIGENSFQ